MPAAAVRISDWDVLDWRRRIAVLYERTRALTREVNVETAHSMWEVGRAHLLQTHPASPVPARRRARFRGGTIAPYDGAYRFVVPVERAGSKERQVVTGTDGTVTYRRIGRIRLPDLGTLDTWWVVGYGGGLFLPMKDGSSGTQTYGGGRYLLDTIKGADLGGSTDRLVVDLNFAYQPSCAYDESWVCPLPGPENTLAAPIPVGELYRPV